MPSSTHPHAARAVRGKHIEWTLQVAVLFIGIGGQEQHLLRPLFPSDDLTLMTVPSIVPDDATAIDAPDLIVMEAGKDQSATEELVRRARRRWPSATLFCVHVGKATDAVELLDAGADDIVMRNTPDAVLAALVSAALRRIRIANAQLRVTFGDLVYDREGRRVWCAGKEVVFTPRELRLFDILFMRAGNSCSADALQAYVWHDGQPARSNSLAVYIGYLRRKLANSRVSVVETLRGSGYRLARRSD